jgi:predicted nucleotidyltransferase
MAFDPIAVLSHLEHAGVRYVVIGGIAATIYGSPSVTGDLDICYERSNANLQRLADVLRELHARLRGALDDVPFLLDAKTLKAGDSFTFVTNLGDLDILDTPSGTAGYDDLRAGAETLDLDGLTVPVVSLDDLIRMKRAAGQPKDRIELEVLGALRDEREGGAPT